MNNYINITDFVGKTFVSVFYNNFDLVFETEDGKHYYMGHEQNCCERVDLEDICGDLEDLENTPILIAEEVSSNPPEGFDENDYESCTWTFYHISTIKGTVSLRWFGTSNGYYSEAVNIWEEEE